MVYYKDSPIICAMDTSDLQQAYDWIEHIERTDCMAKIGLELSTSPWLHKLLFAMACSDIDIFFQNFIRMFPKQRRA